MFYKVKNNDYVGENEGRNNTSISRRGRSRVLLRFAIWCFLLAKLPLEFDIRYDRGRVEGEHLLLRLQRVGT